MPKFESPDRRVRLTIIALLTIGAAGCGIFGDEAESPSTTSEIATSISTAPAITSAPITPSSTTAPPGPPTSPGPVFSSVAPSVPITSSPISVPVDTSPATTEPLSIDQLVLSDQGIGGTHFGAEADQVIEYVTSIIGSNTADTGWVAPDTFGDCVGTVARKVDWGVLTLLFTDQSSYSSGRNHFIGWEYGRVGAIGDQPAGLRTAGGLTLGSRVVDIRGEFPNASINEGDAASNFPDNFYISDGFYGLLTGTADDDLVTVMFGGDGCGE